MGVQSMCQEELDSLHRRHSVVDVEQAIEAIKRVGFPCVNLDIIYGIPGQTIQSLKNTSDRILSYLMMWKNYLSIHCILKGILGCVKTRLFKMQRQRSCIVLFKSICRDMATKDFL